MGKCALVDRLKGVQYTNRMLAVLSVGLHLLVAVLLLVGLLADFDPLAVLFGAWYLAGTAPYNRGVEFRQRTQWAWLAVIVALWGWLTYRSEAYVWLEFPLVMLGVFLLPTLAGLALSAALLATTLAVTVPESGVSGAIGPVIGTVLGVIIVHSYTMLRGEAEHYKQLALRLEVAERSRGAAEERARLSREVHDTMAQGLSSIVLLGRALDKQLDHDTADAARETLTTIRNVAAENLAEARRFVAVNAAGGAGQPPRRTLPEQVRELARAAEDRQRALGEPLEVRVNVVDVVGPAAEVAERVVREGLSNVVRHAQASKAVVTVDKLGDTITVDVFDNGRGMSGKEGFGLKGLRARVEEAGGELSVEGNVLAATIPAQLKEAP